MSHPARPALLGTIEGAATTAPSPTTGTPMGMVERIVRSLPVLEQAMHAADAAVGACKGSKAQKTRLIGLHDDAATAFYGAEDEAMAAEPEMLLDALLIIALAASAARTAAECGRDDTVSGWLRNAARYSRRAADFIAAQAGHDLGALLGAEHDHPDEIEI